MKENLFGVNKKWTYGLMALCVLGIVIGSFYDYQISEALANRTDIGSWFAWYGQTASYVFPAIGGVCIYKGLKGDRYESAGRAGMIVGFIASLLFCNDQGATEIRAAFGYVPGESSPLLSLAGLLFWIAIILVCMFVAWKVLDERNRKKLIMAGLMMIAVTALSFWLKDWLKLVGSRPRYKYLITLDDPHAAFRNWWEMIPYLAGKEDGLMSWPSGHMLKASVLLMLPVLSDVSKKSSPKRNLVCWFIAIAYIMLFAYNRIHMTNHFLSDVSWGTLIQISVMTLLYRAMIIPAEDEV